MGLYINPPNESKEAFLEREATLLDSAPEFLPGDTTLCVVCLVDNRIFTAAGVAFSEDELKVFKESGPSRPRRWYLLEKRYLPYVTDPEILPSFFPEFKK